LVGSRRQAALSLRARAHEINHFPPCNDQHPTMRSGSPSSSSSRPSYLPPFSPSPLGIHSKPLDPSSSIRRVLFSLNSSPPQPRSQYPAAESSTRAANTPGKRSLYYGGDSDDSSSEEEEEEVWGIASTRSALSRSALLFSIYRRKLISKCSPLLLQSESFPAAQRSLRIHRTRRPSGKVRSSTSLLSMGTSLPPPPRRPLRSSQSSQADPSPHRIHSSSSSAATFPPNLLPPLLPDQLPPLPFLPSSLPSNSRNFVLTRADGGEGDG